jgi:acetylornithine deacetylase/succinyl-diaminopimelate desuccinylase-like protein
MKLADDLQKFAYDELCKLARIPSISFDGFDPKAVVESGEATADLLKRSGFQNVEILTLDGCFPYVVGDYIVDPSLPTALLYAHHDVQPAGREELWKTKPFEPTEIDGRLYGRGTADDKAGILVHAAALKYYVDSSEGKPPMNLKVIIEGEEEIGSGHLFEFLRQNKERLQADAIIVTDTANIQSGVPSLTTGLRGLIAIDIEVKSLKAPLHSGLWGGAVTDPTNVLVKMISSLTDENGKMLLESTEKVNRKDLKPIPVSLEEFAEQAGVLKLESVPDDYWHKMWHEPAFSVNAIQASSEKLANNVICDRAFARIGLRIPGSQRAEQVKEELMTKLKTLAPESVEVKLTCESSADGWETDPYEAKNRWAYSAVETALEKAYDKPLVYIGCGASIPFIQPFEKALEAPVLTLGVEDPYTLAHSENESLLLSDFYKAIAGEIELFKELKENFAKK